MATERILFNFSGFLSVGRVSSIQSAPYQRTVTQVELSTKGQNPAANPVGVQIRLNTTPQALQYVLPAGLRYADNGSGLIVPAGAQVDVIISTATDADAADLDVWVSLDPGPVTAGVDTTDCGLGTLGQLKRFLINSSIVAQTTWDEQIKIIGRGVAKSFNNATGRILKRETGARETFGVTHRNLVFQHIPIEQISKLEVMYNTADGWIDISAGLAVCLLDNFEGILRIKDMWPAVDVFRHDQAGLYRATVDGGYWYDPTDNGTGTVPMQFDGVTPANILTDDLQEAWFLQCQHLWVNRDNLGITWSPAGDTAHDTRKSLAGVKLLPTVAQVLTAYTAPIGLR